MRSKIYPLSLIVHSYLFQSNNFTSFDLSSHINLTASKNIKTIISLQEKTAMMEKHSKGKSLKHFHGSPMSCRRRNKYPNQKGVNKLKKRVSKF